MGKTACENKGSRHEKIIVCYNGKGRWRAWIRVMRNRYRVVINYDPKREPTCHLATRHGSDTGVHFQGKRVTGKLETEHIDRPIGEGLRLLYSGTGKSKTPTDQAEMMSDIRAARFGFRYHDHRWHLVSGFPDRAAHEKDPTYSRSHRPDSVIAL